jgi:hypothetical protein
MAALGELSPLAHMRIREEVGRPIFGSRKDTTAQVVGSARTEHDPWR